jgi:hypothetical protein
MPADSQAQPPRFRLWLRRQNVAEGAYSLRFEVMEAKGILRVARPGVLIDPPARPVGMEERLTAGQLRSTRFILVWDGGRARQGHLLNRVDELQLERVETDRWHEMEVVVDGGFRYAVLAAVAPPAETRPARPKSRRPSLSELRQALDSITVHDEHAEDVDSALASLTGPPPPPPRRIDEVVDSPLPGAAGLAPPPATEARRSPVRVPNTHEVRFGAKREAAANALLPGAVPEPPRGLDDAPTAAIEDVREALPRPGSPPPPPAFPAKPNDDAPPSAPDDDLLALGEADESAEHAEALALGEADEGEEADGGVDLGLVEGAGDDPVSDLPQLPPIPVVPNRSGAARPAPPPARARPPQAAGDSAATPGAAFFASFSDAEEEAVFSIDLPTHRKNTEHVSVRRGEDDDAVVFAREEIPAAMEAEAAPDEEGEGIALGDGEGEDVALAAEPAEEVEAPAPVAAAPPPPAAPRARAAAPASPAPGEDGMIHRSGAALVRHLRRREEQQRARIAGLEARVRELEAALAGRPPRG